METKDLIEWLEGEKPFFDAKIKDMLQNIQDRLVTAEKMAEALRGIADRHEGICCDVKQWTVDKCDNALKQWENLK